jgi:hypothetical protein
MAISRKAYFCACTRLALVGVLVLIGVLVATSIAQAAVSISRAELSGTQLRIEGQASPNRTITVDGVAMGTSDGDGKFRVERSGFTAPADCTADVNDGSASPTSARLSACTVSSSSPQPTSPTCTIIPTTFPDGNVGTLNTWYFSTTGCPSEKPVQFSVVSGQIPRA